jgi:enterochelin esterase-like enzyme
MSAISMRQYAGRTVWVHLPPGYDARRPDPYPLLLLHDGQNLSASRPEAWGGSWHADETVDWLVRTGRIRPIVLAGIDHAGDGRLDDYTPTRMARKGGGRAGAYARAVLDEVIPGLAADYHVRADAEGVGLGGSSLGGLVTLWMAAAHPGRFGRLIVLSPSIWWDGRAILRLLDRRPIDPATRVWLHAGWREGRRVIRDARAVADRLREAGHGRLRYVEDADGDHSEQSWARQLVEAIDWLYE